MHFCIYSDYILPPFAASPLVVWRCTEWNIAVAALITWLSIGSVLAYVYMKPTSGHLIIQTSRDPPQLPTTSVLERELVTSSPKWKDIVNNHKLYSSTHQHSRQFAGGMVLGYVTPVSHNFHHSCSLNFAGVVHACIMYTSNFTCISIYVYGHVLFPICCCSFVFNFFFSLLFSVEQPWVWCCQDICLQVYSHIPSLAATHLQVRGNSLSLFMHTDIQMVRVKCRVTK